MNITPNSFSDGGEVPTPESFLKKFNLMGSIEALDIGAESTAPMNEGINWEAEWERWQVVLPLLPTLFVPISADTYHPETINMLVKFWKDRRISAPLIWNDISGKFDEAAKEFLREGDTFHYVLCHNRAPSRELSGKHMQFVREGELFGELQDFFLPVIHPRIIFDPCLGFSKTYDQNWWVLENFKKLQEAIKHDRWLLGFSRKSFLRKRFNLGLSEMDQLDQTHADLLRSLRPELCGEVWIRTHRPQLIEET